MVIFACLGPGRQSEDEDEVVLLLLFLEVVVVGGCCKVLRGLFCDGGDVMMEGEQPVHDG